MKCPVCEYERTEVYGHYDRKGRYREGKYRRCPKCGYKFKTVEFWVEEDIVQQVYRRKITTHDAYVEMVRRYG